MADIMSVHEHTDPDAQATVTDFIDYTEYLPCDLERALTLIGKLDNVYSTATEELHLLLKDYCKLPRDDDRQASVLEAEALRAKISQKLTLAVHVREAAYVEASRLHDDMSRHKTRLTSIHSKLLALPKPPSRDPTPQPAQSPTMSKREAGDMQRLKLRVDGARAGLKKLGGRPTPRVIVPGEVLPPRNPDSPTASMYDEFTSSDSSDDEATPPRLQAKPRKYPKMPKPPRPPKIRLPKIPKERKERPPRPPRPHGVMGTNVHSSVAGISTSNALMLLDPPPPDAKIGSEHAPWTRLTEWEMAKLRKRMKKNAIWAPSDTMIRRELGESGRGIDAYWHAKKLAEETGEEFLDYDDLTNRDPSEPLRIGEIPLDAKSRAPSKAMIWHLQKKKRKDFEDSQAKDDVQGSGPAPNSTEMKASDDSATPGLQLSAGEDKIVLKHKKRKRDADDTESVTEEAKANAQLDSEIILASKSGQLWNKRRLWVEDLDLDIDPNLATITTTTTVPLAGATVVSQPASPAGNRKGRNVHISIKTADGGPNTASTSRPVSRQSSRRASAAPESARENNWRKSATPAPQAPAASSRLRTRRQAPGIVTNSQDGGAAVSIGKRKSAPRKKGGAGSGAAGAGAKKDVTSKADGSLVTDEEVIDPNEETYCICGGVSFGIMIMCENPDCEKEWFHLDCVGLKEPPARRSKWWCPDCRKKLSLDG